MMWIRPDELNSYIYRTFHPKITKCIFFSSVHGIFSWEITKQSVNIRRLDNIHSIQASERNKKNPRSPKCLPLVPRSLGAVPLPLASVGGSQAKLLWPLSSVVGLRACETFACFLGSPLQYSCLKNPMDREAWQAMVHRITKVRHNLAHMHVRVGVS